MIGRRTGGELMLMGLSKQPSSIQSLAIRTIVYSMLTSGTITGIGAYYWRRQLPDWMGRGPGAYSVGLAKAASLIFWVTVALMGSAFSIYYVHRSGDKPAPKSEAESDERGGGCGS